MNKSKRKGECSMKRKMMKKVLSVMTVTAMLAGMVNRISGGCYG